MEMRGQLASCSAMQVILASGILWFAAKGLRVRMSGGGAPTCMPSRFQTCGGQALLLCRRLSH